MSDVLKKHYQMLYPTVRIRVETKDGAVAGSGTLLFSDKNPETNEIESYVLTNYHVVEPAIQIKEKWDARIGRNIKVDERADVDVDFFKYNYVSRCIGAKTIRGQIVAYESDEDLALLKLRDIETQWEHVANIFPYKMAKREIRLFDKIYAVGAALAHPPIVTEGIINSMDDIIENKTFWMGSAPIIFGNSGGAVYRFSEKRGRYEFIGVPSRIQISVMGWSQDAVTHMGYFIPIERVTQFLKKNFYNFIYDKKADIVKCHKKREEFKRKEREKIEKTYGVVL